MAINAVFLLRIMYAVLLGFNESDNNKIKFKIQDVINNIESCSFMMETLPHITICCHELLDKQEWIEDVEYYFSSVKKFKLFFESLGTFLENGTIYLSPVPNKNLWDIHKNYIGYFKKYRPASKYYEIDNWKPHCTLFNKLPHGILIDCLDYLSKNLESIEVEVDKIILTEFKIENGNYEIIKFKEFLLDNDSIK